MAKILDCTLRDGGYYNNWDFPPSVVERYLSALQHAKVDYVEIGFRALNQPGFLGPFAFSKDAFISQFETPDDVKLAVMINASDFVKDEDGGMDAIDKNFVDRKNSPVDLVRVACHYGEHKKAIPLIGRLKEKGYEVGLNLMQIAMRTKDEILIFANDIDGVDIDLVYIADSTGSLTPIQVEEIIALLKKSISQKIGVHMHDNMGHAEANSNAAIKSGAFIVDATLTGMGRGPGNVKTENLISSHEYRNKKTPNLVPVIELIEDYFQPLQADLGWGRNVFYDIAGQNKIHPTFIQTMLDDDRYNALDIFNAIENLGENASSFSFDALNRTRSEKLEGEEGTWDPKSEILGRNVLLVGNGGSLRQHKDAIELFISQTKPFVICLNAINNIDLRLIDIHAVINLGRIYQEASSYSKLLAPIVVPSLRSLENIDNYLSNSEVRTHGIAVHPETFSFSSRKSILPNELALSYGLAIANAGGARLIYLAGIDGYDDGDIRNAEITDTLSVYGGQDDSVKVVSITPTSFSLPVESVYSF